MCIYKTDDGKCKKFSDDKTTSWCVDAPCEYEKQSNYDRIQSISLDEMAKDIYLYAHNMCRCCIYSKGWHCTSELKTCVNGIKQWLESEVDE